MVRSKLDDYRKKLENLGKLLLENPNEIGLYAQVIKTCVDSPEPLSVEQIETAIGLNGFKVRDAVADLRDKYRILKEDKDRIERVSKSSVISRKVFSISPDYRSMFETKR